MRASAVFRKREEAAARSLLELRSRSTMLELQDALSAARKSFAATQATLNRVRRERDEWCEHYRVLYNGHNTLKDNLKRSCFALVAAFNPSHPMAAAAPAHSSSSSSSASSSCLA